MNTTIPIVKLNITKDNTTKNHIFKAESENLNIDNLCSQTHENQVMISLTVRQALEYTSLKLTLLFHRNYLHLPIFAIQK